ncbi:O-antigen ligase family protein [Roseomonas sp. USHLN139]|uniref:O-antigen ligase family protein n=1 Tax=Roseomonas sp. USHLN139 TaxID=3081298 RepID=UPI003B027430
MALPRIIWTAPTAPILLAALLAPTVAVLQSKAMAPIGLVALVAAVLLARRESGRWPWPLRLGSGTTPGQAALGLGLLLGLWGAASAAWAPEPARALKDGLAFAGLVLLAAAAARAVAQSGPEARAPLPHALVAGLFLGLGLALADHLSGSALRAAVRGLAEPTPQLAFGLKPAASVMALLLPLLAATPWGRAARIALPLAGALLLLAVPGDTARIAVIAGLAAAGLAALLQRWAPGRLAAVLGLALAAIILATPPLLPALLQKVAPVAERLPPSAIHRLVIWQFGAERAAERPLLGWGMEASRALPGGDDRPSPDRLAAIGVTSPALLDWFAAPHVKLMPLHPHNGPLQLRLELGTIGSLLAAAAVMLLAMQAGLMPLGAGALGSLVSGFVTFLASFGAWQSWWLCSLALALVLAQGLQDGRKAGPHERPGQP